MGIEVDKESNSKRKSRSDVSEYGVLDDDERPLGFMFQVKHAKSGTKTKRNVKEDVILEGSNPGEMEDTLACLRKKLKAPKRVSVGGNEEPDDVKLTEAFVSDVEASLHAVQDVGHSPKLVKRTSRVSPLERESKVIGGTSRLSENGDCSLSEDLEDSLSDIVKKSHSDSSRLGSKRKKQAANILDSGEALNQKNECIQKGRSSKQIMDSSTPEDVLHSVSVRGPSNLLPSKRDTKPRQSSTSDSEHSAGTSNIESLEEGQYIGKIHSCLPLGGKLRIQKTADCLSLTPLIRENSDPESIPGSRFSSISATEYKQQNVKLEEDNKDFCQPSQLDDRVLNQNDLLTTECVLSFKQFPFTSSPEMGAAVISNRNGRELLESDVPSEDDAMAAPILMKKESSASLCESLNRLKESPTSIEVQTSPLNTINVPMQHSSQIGNESGISANDTSDMLFEEAKHCNSSNNAEIVKQATTNDTPNHCPEGKSLSKEISDNLSNLSPDAKSVDGSGIGVAFVADKTDKKQTFIPRISRRIKKYRHGDMAYEGDADWDVLMQDQCYSKNTTSVGNENLKQVTGTKDKTVYRTNLAFAESDGITAAVSVGLKARAAGHIEKIKFKDVLKRKGGLQEYLQCRNLILGLWSRDMKKVLTLEDCGISTASNVESPRASLFREVYAFLDRNGSINAGITLDKKHQIYESVYSSPKETFENHVSDTTYDIENANPFILHEDAAIKAAIASTECVESEDAEVESNKQTDSEMFSVSDGSFATSLKHENDSFKVGVNYINPSSEKQPSVDDHSGMQACSSLHITIANQCSDLAMEERSTDCLGTHIKNTMTQMKDGSSIHMVKISDMLDIAENVRPIEKSVVDSVLPHLVTDSTTVCGSGEHCKKIIVIGAGPAGLTAARHLQRQGFSVTVLEARDRIGGRVYTDRSSLSVPVDLGASIITGVEADIATERRPDPSSLICAQLGLDLTVLNSDCPLYDIVTGHKVPADLDEALEAEYNSLLDNMDMIISQKHENVMEMSLEEGLEYAMKQFRAAQSISAATESELVGKAEVSEFSESSSLNSGNGTNSRIGVLSPIERRIMDWHFAHLEYGCAASLKDVSLPHWNQDDEYGGFGGPHCMIKGGFGNVVETLSEGLTVHLKHVVTEVQYGRDPVVNQKQSEVKVVTSDGKHFVGDAVLITIPLGCLKAGNIKFTPPLPEWKEDSIQRLGFGVLNKVVLEFSEVFWDDNVDYFGATAEESCSRGRCFMFWNVKKTVGAPVLIALVAGMAAIDGQHSNASEHVNHALKILRKLFGEASVPDPVASIVTNWGMDPFSRGAYSFVAVGASGEDYDILARPISNSVFFAGEATCKEHPDTVGGAMLSGLREAVRMMDIFTTGIDHTAEVEAMSAVQRIADSRRNEVRDLIKRLESCKLSYAIAKNSLGPTGFLSKEAVLQDMFCTAKTIAGRLHLAKELLHLPVESLRSFAGTKEGLIILNSWILDSLGKDATHLLRHCVRLLVLVSTDLVSVRLSGIGKTVKDKVCVHTSRDIRAVASQLVNLWIEIFRKEKASNGALKLLKNSTVKDTSKSKSKDQSSGKPPLGMINDASARKRNLHRTSLIDSTCRTNNRKANCKTKIESSVHVNSGASRSCSVDVSRGTVLEVEDSVMSAEEAAAFAAAEAARIAALAAAEAYASSEADCSKLPELPKIPSFHKFARREQHLEVDDFDLQRKNWPDGGRQDCLSEINSRNCRVRNWPVDFSYAHDNFDGSRLHSDTGPHWDYPGELLPHHNLREHSGDSVTIDSTLKRAWVDTDAISSGGVKDYTAIERWQSQAMDANADLYNSMHMGDEENPTEIIDSTVQKCQRIQGECTSQATESVSLSEGKHRGVEQIKQGVIDYVASLLMPLYKNRKIDREGYKAIMKKTATKVMDQCTETEKLMTISEFLDFRRKNKIRAFVDRLIERHIAINPNVKL